MERTHPWFARSQFREWIGVHGTKIGILSTVAASFAMLGIDKAWDENRPDFMLAAVVFFGFFVAVPAFASKENKLGQNVVFASDTMKQLLEALAHAIQTRSPLGEKLMVRCCVMLIVKTGTGLRRRVHRASAFNMETPADTDNELEIGMEAGVSGQAVLERKTVYGDLRVAPAAGAPTWGLAPKEQQLVRKDLQCIASAPIHDPDNTTGTFLGTLQVDSIHGVDGTLFADSATRETVARFADVASLLLKVGN